MPSLTSSASSSDLHSLVSQGRAMEGKVTREVSQIFPFPFSFSLFLSLLIFPFSIFLSLFLSVFLSSGNRVASMSLRQSDRAWSTRPLYIPVTTLPSADGGGSGNPPPQPHRVLALTLTLTRVLVRATHVRVFRASRTARRRRVGPVLRSPTGNYRQARGFRPTSCR